MDSIPISITQYLDPARAEAMWRWLCYSTPDTRRTVLELFERGKDWVLYFASEMQEQVQIMESQKRGDSKPLLDYLEKKKQKVSNALQKIHQSAPSASGNSYR